jgi:hypothetical protein
MGMRQNLAGDDTLPVELLKARNDTESMVK